LVAQAVPRLYPHASSLSQAFGAQRKSGINLGVNYQDPDVVRSITSGQRGCNSLGAEKVPMSQALSSIHYIGFRKTSGSNTGKPNLLLVPGGEVEFSSDRVLTCT